MKKKLLIGFSVVSICAAFWACGTGDIETVGMGDENARDLYGFDPDAMDQLVADAKKNCADDPKCVAAQENAEPIGSDDEGDEDNPGDEEDSSASSSPSSSGTTAGSSGAVAGSSAATGTSSAATGTSSATTGTSSATTGSSSSTAKSSSSVYIDPTGTIGGGCKAKKTSIDKGGSTQWYYNRIGTVIPGKYEWTLTGGDITTSTDSLTPAVTYAKAGVYKATLTLNKGMSNEKTITCADSVIVKGEPVKNCVCTNDAKGTVFFKSGSPASVKWSVSGCTGGNTFTYAWDGLGTSGTSSTATGSISTAGSGLAPTLKVTNEEQGSMNVTCAAVTAEQLLSATCGVGPYDYQTSSNTLSVAPGQSFYFRPKSVTGMADNTTATLDLKGTEGTEKQVSVTKGDNSPAVSLTAPTKFGPVTYTLSANGLEVCKATVTVTAPKVACNIGKDQNNVSSSSYSAAPGQSVAFKPNGSGNSWWPQNLKLSMKLEGKGVSKTLSVQNDNNNSAVTFNAPDTLKEYLYKLSLNGTEVCTATLTVAYPKITASTCGFAKESYNSPSKTVTLGPGQQNWFIHPSGWSGWDPNTLGSTLKMLFVGEGYKDTVSVGAYGNGGLKQVTAPTKAGMYTYKVTYGGNDVCSATINVVDPVSCSASKTTINEGESFTFFTPYASGGSCSSATTKENGTTLTSDCKSSQTITPPKAGKFTYTYSASGSYGSGECSVEVEVKEIAPTCAVPNVMRTKGTSFDVVPSSVTGCSNSTEGCGYSLSMGNSVIVSEASGYVSGKLPDQLVGEIGEDTLYVDYTLSLTNGTGTGTCGFTVTYIDTIEVNVTNSFKSYDAGKVYMVTRTSTSGESSFKCKASNTSSKVAGVIGTTTLTIPNQYSSSNGLTLATGTPYVFATDVNAPSGMTCGLSW